VTEKEKCIYKKNNPNITKTAVNNLAAERQEKLAITNRLYVILCNYVM